MKLRILFLFAVFVVVLMLFFSGNYVYLEENELVVTPSLDGNPTLRINDSIYYVRYWTLAPGCYKLTHIGLLDYNLASQTSESRCPVQAKSN